MVRNRKKKSLYEVIGSQGSQLGYHKHLEQLHPDDSKSVEPPAGHETNKAVYTPTRWPKKPALLQFNNGRIEACVPYQAAIAVALGLILLILVAFRLGQMISSREAAEVAQEYVIVEPTEQPAGEIEELAAADNQTEQSEVVPVEDSGNNRIVIQTHNRRADLEPVKMYFGDFGIETEIRQVGSWYYLVTKHEYDNPERQGTDGYAAKQEIIKIGAGYKAPSGYGSFGPKPFHDAYGMKFED